MPSFSGVIEQATSGLYRAGDALDEVLRTLAQLAPRRRLAQPYDGLLKGVLGLAAVIVIDGLAGHPPVLQLLYLAPIWIAFETAGLAVAAVLSLVVVPVATLFSPPAPWGMLCDVFVRSGLMASLIVIMTFHNRRYRTTHESARRDPLTNALNRAGFEVAARGAIEQAIASRQPLTLAMVDCDSFKDLNDTKGHAFGDGVLCTLVRTLTGSVNGAILGRTGGDEFVVVDPGRSADETRRALQHALRTYNDATLVMGRKSSFTVGIAQLGPDGMRYEALLESADRDMYRNKFDRFSGMLVA